MEGVIVIFDSDMLIWLLRGHTGAAKAVEDAPERYLSVQSYMEILQGAKDRLEQGMIRDLLSDTGFIRLPFTENCGHRAAILIEEYALSSGLRAGDAIIAAAALENNFSLMTGNECHFKPIKDLKLKVFKP